MTITIASKRTSGPIGGKSAIAAKLWPNGEISIWRQKTFRLAARTDHRTDHRTDVRMAWFRLQCEAEILREALASILGLSIHSNFDSSENACIPSRDGSLKILVRYGKKGITSYGKRMVRNAAHLIEQLSGKARTIFATVTVPALPIEQMAIVHQQWHKIVELYRLGIKRALQEKGLSGHMVSVSEIQEKRYERSGLPVLHCHSVFCGVTAVGKYALSIEDHDDIWHRALRTVVDIDRAECSVACNLQRIKKSASAYLGKYLSKGASVVQRVMDDGFESWLPKQWWNASRELVREVKSQTRRVDLFADWLIDMAEERAFDVWEWHREVILEMSSGFKISIARYGKLTKRQAAEIQAYYLGQVA